MHRMQKHNKPEIKSKSLAFGIVMQNIGTYRFENKRPAKHIYIFRLTVSSILVLINGSTIFFSLVDFLLKLRASVFLRIENFYLSAF